MIKGETFKCEPGSGEQVSFLEHPQRLGAPRGAGGRGGEGSPCSESGLCAASSPDCASNETSGGSAWTVGRGQRGWDRAEWTVEGGRESIPSPHRASSSFPSHCQSILQGQAAIADSYFLFPGDFSSPLCRHAVDELAPVLFPFSAAPWNFITWGRLTRPTGASVFTLKRRALKLLPMKLWTWLCSPSQPQFT